MFEIFWFIGLIFFAVMETVQHHKNISIFASWNFRWQPFGKFKVDIYHISKWLALISFGIAAFVTAWSEMILILLLWIAMGIVHKILYERLFLKKPYRYKD